MAPVLKTGIPGRVSGVRIPHSPPYSLDRRETRPNCSRSCEKTPKFPDSAPANWTRESDRPNAVRQRWRVFSGQQKRSPVTTRTGGECNAITNRRWLDAGMNLELDFE